MILGTIAKIVPLKKLGDALLSVAGIGKGKMSDTGIVALAVGAIGAKFTGGDPFESVRVLVDLAEQGWPHVLVLVGALTTIAGFFRKAGANLPPAPPK